jgi:hypothetical protein
MPVLLTVYEVALEVPNLTAVAPVKLVPKIVTAVLPAAGPESRLSPVTLGAPSSRAPVAMKKAAWRKSEGLMPLLNSAKPVWSPPA